MQSELKDNAPYKILSPRTPSQNEWAMEGMHYIYSFGLLLVYEMKANPSIQLLWTYDIIDILVKEDL